MVRVSFLGKEIDEKSGLEGDSMWRSAFKPRFCPKRMALLGAEGAAYSIPADEVAGDILRTDPIDDGGWISLGDGIYRFSTRTG